MQISKYLLAAGIFVAGLSPVFAQSDVDDAEERARAREQLNQKMAELEAQLSSGDQPMPPIAPTATEEMTPVPTPAPAPAVEPEPIVSQPEPVKPVPVVPAPAPPVPAPQPAAVKSVPQPLPPVQPAGDEALARAREETRRKIAELNATSGSTAVRPVVKPAPQPAPKPVAQKAPSQPAPKQPAPKPAAPVRQSVVFQDSLRPSDNDAIARAREETRRKIAELDSQERNRGSRPTPMAPARPVTVTPPSVTTNAAPVAPAKGDSFTTGVVVQGSSTQPKAKVVAPPAATKARQQAESQALKAAYETKAPAPPTAMSLVQAPAPAVSAAKQIRLNELLGRYKADKITPEEYHAARAKILAEP